MKPKAFTLKTGKTTRALITDCGISKTFDPLSKGPYPQIHKYQALWDTGATSTVITRKVAEDLGLKPIGKVKSYHANGESIVDVYAVNLFLPNQIGFQFLRVTEGILNGFDVLIGMDIITTGDFSITNVGGETCFSFRIPSVNEVDFEKEINLPSPTPSSAPKVGRNSPCPCNSGKKYKQCCGK